MSSNNAELFKFFYTAQTTIDDDFCYAVESDWYNYIFLFNLKCFKRWKTWQFLINLKMENPDYYFGLPESLSNKKIMSDFSFFY